MPIAATAVVRLLLGPAVFCVAASAQNVIDLGSRRELLVDHFLIERLEGQAALRIGRPRREGVALAFDRPWEGGFSGYVTVLKDGDLYRMYYRGLPAAGRDGSTAEVTCCAESRDGIHWTKPDLGLFEVMGTRANNVVLAGQPPFSHNFAPLLDARPDVPREERYKALAGTARTGLVAFVSADGLHWRKLREEPVIRDEGWVFDSLNVAFWSPAEGCYVAFYRRSVEGVRAIARTTSRDFLEWTPGESMTYSDTGTTRPSEHLYTNATQPYFRAPHLYVALPKRFFPGKVTLTEQQAAELVENPAYRVATSDSVLLTSRGGTLYDRTFPEALIRPGPSLRDWIARGNTPACGVVPADARSMFLYRMAHYAQPTAHVVRYSLRLDGFAALEAPFAGGEMVSRVLRFAGAPPGEKPPREPLPGPIVRERAAPLVGEGSLEIRAPTVLVLPQTRELGAQLTLAAHVRAVPAGRRRLFSSYDGGSTEPGELVFDFDADGDVEPESAAIRFFFDGTVLRAPSEAVAPWHAALDPGTRHHLAATWDDGAIRLYFDGSLVAEGGAPGRGPVTSRRGDLRFGEDYPPTAMDNEPLLGFLDDVLVLRRVLPPTQIETLAREGALAVVDPSRDPGVLLTMEAQGAALVDALRADGGQDARLPPAPGPGDVELLLNFATSAAGSVRVEIQDAAGVPIPGWTLEECDELVGDRIDEPVQWRGRGEVAPLVGRPVRLRLVLRDAEVYSLRFR